MLSVFSLNRHNGQEISCTETGSSENQNIKYVTSTNTAVGEGSGKLIFNVETDQGMAQKGVNFAVVDYDFIDALGIKIVKWP